MPESDYPVIPVAVNEVEEYEDEYLGSKKKFWVLRNGEWWLYKQARPNTPGEAWAEKIAAEVAGLIGVSHALVELADEATDGLGTISRSFVPPDGRLYHGNDILYGAIPDYGRQGRLWVPAHNLGNIVATLRDWANADESSLDLKQTLSGLASYAVLDGLIRNTDRHHENWGLIYRNSTSAYSLAPSYDHASSLGRNLTDDDRNSRLSSNGGVLAYHTYCSGRTFVDPGRRRGPSPIVLAQLICLSQPDLVRPVLERLHATTSGHFRNAVNRVPSSIMSRTAKKFAHQMLIIARIELLRGFAPA